MEERTLSRQAAKKHVAALKKPEDMGRRQWKEYRAYLDLVAGYMPRAWPSQETLARRLGCTTRTIQRYQALAQRYEHLHVTPDAGQKRERCRWARTNQYHFTPPTMTTQSRPKPSTTSTPYGRSGSPVSPPETSSPEKTRPKRPGKVHASRGHEANHRRGAKVREWREPERDLAEPKAPARSKHRTRPRAADLLPPATAQVHTRSHYQQVVRYFEREWDAMVERRSTDRDRYRLIRVRETEGQMVTYLNAHFKRRTLAEVRGHVDRFIESVYRGDTRVKGGQSAWMCFTGYWGRRQAATPKASSSFDFKRYLEQERVKRDAHRPQ